MLQVCWQLVFCSQTLIAPVLVLLRRINGCLFYRGYKVHYLRTDVAADNHLEDGLASPPDFNDIIRHLLALRNPFKQVKRF